MHLFSDVCSALLFYTCLAKPLSFFGWGKDSLLFPWFWGCLLLCLGFVSCWHFATADCWMQWLEFVVFYPNGRLTMTFSKPFYHMQRLSHFLELPQSYCYSYMFQLQNVWKLIIWRNDFMNWWNKWVFASFIRAKVLQKVHYFFYWI